METYCGIADAHGIESFLPLEKSNISIMIIRAHANRHRHAVVYAVEMEPKLIELINIKLKIQKFMEALKCLKTFVTEIKIEKSFEKSWRLIPNHDLDPYY